MPFPLHPLLVMRMENCFLIFSNVLRLNTSIRALFMGDVVVVVVVVVAVVVVVVFAAENDGCCTCTCTGGVCLRQLLPGNSSTMDTFGGRGHCGTYIEVRGEVEGRRVVCAGTFTTTYDEFDVTAVNAGVSK